VASVAFLLFGATSGLFGKDFFDPTRNPMKDLKAAEARATAEHKNILVDVGCDSLWGSLRIETAFKNGNDLTTELKKSYIMVRVCVCPETDEARYKEFFAKYPQSTASPDLFVLASDGTFLGKLDDLGTGLEKWFSGSNQAAILTFLKKWAPKPKSSTTK